MTETTVAVLSMGDVFHSRYRVIRCISAGGMGVVYEVIDEKTESPRALKVMLPSLVEDIGLRGRFEREAKVTGAIESDHLVRVLDAGVDDATGTPFLAMELLRGEEMGALLKRRTKLPSSEVVLYLSQVARALEKTHAAGIIHRDLKPENLFTTQRDDGSSCVKILDFGIAKVIVESNQVARTTKLVGTPLYMAPEQIRGDSMIGPGADVHALGHIAYTLLVGEAYWTEEANGTALYSMMTKIIEGLREPASARARRRRGVELPPGFDAWIKEVTAPRVDERLTSAWDAINKLGALIGVVVSRPSLPEVLITAAPSPPKPSLAATELAVLEPSPAPGPPPEETKPAITEVALQERLPAPESPPEAAKVAATEVVIPGRPSAQGPPPERRSFNGMDFNGMDLDDRVQLLRSLTRGAFIARHAGTYMLFLERGSEGLFSFYTAPVTLADKRKLESMMAKPDKKLYYEFMAIAKARGQPYPDRISVGRSRNCDLVIRDPSVSKLHAHFRPRDNGGLDLIDLDSNNGTWVNGVQLKPNKPEPVWAGDTVRFANVTVCLLDAGALFDVVR